MYILGSNDEMLLVLTETNQHDRMVFEIWLKDTPKLVGNISYHFREVDIFGNVECFIFEEYRGNNYAKEALKILIENIHKIDDKDIYLSIHPDNIASIKSVVDCGAEFHHVAKIPKTFSFSEDGKYNYANVYIIKNDKINNKKIKKKNHLKRY